MDARSVVVNLKKQLLMTNLTLRFEPCVAKYWNYIHTEFSPDKKHLPSLLRSLVIAVVEPLYLFEPSAASFDRHEDGEANLDKIYHSALVDKLTIQITTFYEVHETAINFHNNQLWVPPMKMYYLNRAIKDLINLEINNNVERAIASNQSIQDAIFEIFTKYDFDDQDYKIDSAIKMNQRHRKRVLG